MVSGRMLKSILISCTSRLQGFDLSDVKELTEKSGGRIRKINEASVPKLLLRDRLTKGRIAGLLRGIKKVKRTDILTLLLFLAENRRYLDEGDKFSTHMGWFIDKADRLLDECRFSKLDVVNPYDVFIVMCLQTEEPVTTFNDFWYLAYQDREVSMKGASLTVVI